MARISPNNIRFRTKEIICQDLARILNDSELHVGTKLAVVDQIIWVWSEFDGKYKGCKFWSQAAIISNSSGKGLIHEHIVPRKIVRKKLLEIDSPTPDSIRELLDQMCIGVVVTKEDNDRLNNLGLKSGMPENWDGCDLWIRHKVAGIVPVQRKENSRAFRQ